MSIMLVHGCKFNYSLTGRQNIFRPKARNLLEKLNVKRASLIFCHFLNLMIKPFTSKLGRA